MSLLSLIMWWFLSWWLMVYWNQPLDTDLIDKLPTPTIQHLWFSSDDQRQAIIQKAYSLWWIDFVTMIECENGTWDSKRISKTNDHWICQLNYKYNKKFINSDWFKDVYTQLEYCYEKWKINPKLWYWPNRKINGQLCKDYVLDRFIVK